MRCLVVDDEEDVGVLLRYYLGARGAEVDMVRTGAAAREAAAATRYDALFLDVNLPGETGPDLLTALRAAGQAPGHVFLLSALPPFDLERLAREHDVHPVPKPFTFEDLDAVVGAVLTESPNG